MFKSYKKYYKTQDMHGSHIRIMYKPIGYYLTELLSKTRITPNQVTFFQFIFFLLTGVFYYFGTYPYLIFGALSFQIAHILDNVDGMLARKKGISNNYGAWLDDQTTFFSRVIVFLGIIFGLYRFNQDILIWLFGFLAVTAIYVYDLMYEQFNKFYPGAKEAIEKEKSKRSRFLRNFYFTGNLLVVIISLAGLLNMLYPLLIFISAYGWLFNVALFIVFSKKIKSLGFKKD